MLASSILTTSSQMDSTSSAVERDRQDPWDELSDFPSVD